MNHYFLTKKQEEFIKILINENFSPAFGEMLKRVLREKEYNEVERTRLKVIRLSYIKKRIKPKWDVDKLNSTMGDINLFNAKLECCNKIFKRYTFTKKDKDIIIGKFENAKTVDEVKYLYEFFDNNIRSGI